MSERRFKHSFLFLCAALLTLTGCDIGWEDLKFGSSAPESSDTPTPPNVIDQDAPPQAPVDPILGAPAFEAHSGGMMGSMGLNLPQYLSQPVDNPNERLARIEKVLIAMHRDMRVMGPEIQDLVSDHENMVQPVVAPVSHDAPVATGAPLPVAAPITDGTQVQPGPRPMNGSPAPIVTGIRTGEHADKVRIVFDVNKKTSYKADLDNTEGILVVELPGAQWKPPVTKESFGRTPVVKSYKVDGLGNGGGSIFILQLKQATSIVHQGKYPALSGGGERIVIDLKK